MARISPKRRRTNVLPRYALWAMLVVVAAGILLVWRGPVTALFWTAGEPLFALRGALVNQNEVAQLKSELETTKALAQDRQFLYQENLALKALLGRMPEGGAVLATVLMRPPGVPYGTLILDAGVKEGVARGDLVFAAGSVVLGSVTEVYSSTSRVTLFSAPGQVHEALIFTEGGSIPVSLEGRGGGSFTGRIPAGTPVTVGATVLFPNITPVFAAEVSYVEQPEGESFLRVYMHLSINPLELYRVEVRKQSI